MNFTVDKALLWALPYLFILSIAYYLGYWGTLDVDAFNYYNVQDLIKGITLPILFPVLGTLLVIIIIIIVIGYFTLTLKIKASVWLKISMVMIPYTVLQYYAWEEGGGNNNSGIYDYPGFLIPLYMTIPTIIGVFYYIKSDDSDNESVKITKSIGVYALAFLPLNGNYSAIQTAIQLKSNSEFKYIRTNEYDSLFLFIKKPTLKYVGKAGDYHFFLSQENDKRVVVPASQFKALILYTLIASDSNSVKQYNLVVQQFNKSKYPSTRLLPPARPALPSTPKLRLEADSTGRKRPANTTSSPCGPSSLAHFS